MMPVNQFDRKASLGIQTSPNEKRIKRKTTATTSTKDQSNRHQEAAKVKPAMTKQNGKNSKIRKDRGRHPEQQRDGNADGSSGSQSGTEDCCCCDSLPQRTVISDVRDIPVEIFEGPRMRRHHQEVQQQQRNNNLDALPEEAAEDEGGLYLERMTDEVDSRQQVTDSVSIPDDVASLPESDDYC